MGHPVPDSSQVHPLAAMERNLRVLQEELARALERIVFLEQRPVCTHHPRQELVNKVMVTCTCWVINGPHSESCAVTRAFRRAEQARIGEMLVLP